MAKNTRNKRQVSFNKRVPDKSLKVINLGRCDSPHCSNKEEHYHGLIYTKGFAPLEVVSQAESTLRRIGFEGTLEVQTIPISEFYRRESLGDWL